MLQWPWFTGCLFKIERCAYCFYSEYEFVFRILFIASTITGFDALSKWAILHFLLVHTGESGCILTSFLNIVKIVNHGISFGIFRHLNNAALQFIVIFALICSVILMWTWHKKDGRKITLYPIAMILGGAMGNIIDRFWHGGVLDFIDFHIGKYHYPAFNFADTMIVVGGVMVLYLEWKKRFSALH